MFEDRLRGNSEAAWCWKQLELAPGSVSEEELERLKTATEMRHGDGGLALPNLENVGRYAYIAGISDALNTTYAKQCGMLDRLNASLAAGNTKLKFLTDVEKQIQDFRVYLGIPTLD